METSKQPNGKEERSICSREEKSFIEKFKTAITVFNIILLNMDFPFSKNYFIRILHA